MFFVCEHCVVCVQYFFDQTPLLLFLHCLFCAAIIFEDGIYTFEKSADINIWLARAGMYGRRKGLKERSCIACGPLEMKQNPSYGPVGH